MTVTKPCISAWGFQRRELNIKGADAKGVLWGMDFLTDVNMGKAPKIGKRVVVIGGGNVLSKRQ